MRNRGIIENALYEKKKRKRLKHQKPVHYAGPKSGKDWDHPILEDVGRLLQKALFECTRETSRFLSATAYLRFENGKLGVGFWDTEFSQIETWVEIKLLSEIKCALKEMGEWEEDTPKAIENLKKLSKEFMNSAKEIQDFVKIGEENAETNNGNHSD